MNRVSAFASVFVMATGAASSLLAAPAFASGTSRIGCEGPLVRGACPPAAYLVNQATRCAFPLSCTRNDPRGLSTAEMIYLHETVAGDAVPASAAAAWSSALGQTQSANAEAKVADRSRQNAATRKTTPNSTPDTLPRRGPNES